MAPAAEVIAVSDRTSNPPIFLLFAYKIHLWLLFGGHWSTVGISGEIEGKRSDHEWAETRRVGNLRSGRKL